MKKNLLSVFILMSAVLTQAQTQIPALQFETWTVIPNCSTVDSASGFTHLDLEFYRISNKCTSTPSILRSTDSYAGTYAMEIKATHVNSLTLSTEANLATGVGGANIPYNERPISLKGYYKFTKGGTDTVGILIETISNFNTTGKGIYSITSSSSGYTAFEIPLNYSSTDATDHLRLLFSLGNSNKDADANSVLLLDALELNYTPTSISYQQSNNSLDVFVANNQLKFSENVSYIYVNSLMGENKIKETNNTKMISLESLSTGLYIVTYKYKEAYYSQKIFVQ